jgi:hypothetical protein
MNTEFKDLKMLDYVVFGSYGEKRIGQITRFSSAGEIVYLNTPHGSRWRFIDSVTKASESEIKEMLK